MTSPDGKCGRTFTAAAADILMFNVQVIGKECHDDMMMITTCKRPSDKKIFFFKNSCFASDDDEYQPFLLILDH